MLDTRRKIFCGPLPFAPCSWDSSKISQSLAGTKKYPKPETLKDECLGLETKGTKTVSLVLDENF